MAHQDCRFGLSNTNEGNKLLKTACGRHAMQHWNDCRRYHGPLADIWSVGVILFAMVCGYLPFEDNNTAHLYRRYCGVVTRLPNSYLHKFKDLIARILNTDPTKRYTTYDIRQHAWFGQGSRNGSKWPRRRSRYHPRRQTTFRLPSPQPPSHPAAKAPPKEDQVAKRNEMLSTVDETVLRQMADLGLTLPMSSTAWWQGNTTRSQLHTSC